MRLIKTALLNSIAVSIKILTLLGLNKILAVYVGPVGYASIGQFQNALQIISTLASGAFSTGITRYTAEYYKDEKSQHTIWRTAGTLALIGSIFWAVAIFIFHNQLSVFFLRNDEYATVFIVLAATVVFFVFNALLLAVLNGKKQISQYVIANIAGSLFSLLVTTVMTVEYGLYGALVSLSLQQSLSFFVTLYICQKTDWFSYRYFFGRIDWIAAKKLFAYSFMAITTAVCAPLTQVFVRNYIGIKLGWEYAGYWEAMTRLSSAYLLFITGTLSVYYLPRLSELTDHLKIKYEILNGYKILLPTSIFCSLCIYLLRKPIINLLFSPSFFIMHELFAWQLIGDTLKIASWLFSYIYIAKGFVRFYIISEVVFSLLFLLLVVLFEHYLNLQGVVIAYAVTYLVYFLAMFISLKFFRIL